jgi:flagellar biosynthesis/type III secretory pathway protein FliH
VEISGELLSQLLLALQEQWQQQAQQHLQQAEQQQTGDSLKAAAAATAAAATGFTDGTDKALEAALAGVEHWTAMQQEALFAVRLLHSLSGDNIHIACNYCSLGLNGRVKGV